MPHPATAVPRPLRVEGAQPIAADDLLLAGWILVLERLLMWLFGADPLLWILEHPADVAGGFGLALPGSAVVGLLAFLIFTRDPPTRRVTPHCTAAC